MEKVKDQKDDVKSENEVFEAKPSSSFSGFGFNQLSDPLVFSNYGAEPEAHAGHLEKVFPRLISIRFGHYTQRHSVRQIQNLDSGIHCCSFDRQSFCIPLHEFLIAFHIFRHRIHS